MIKPKPNILCIINVLVVVAKLEELKKDIKFIGQMANVSFAASESLGG